MQAIKAHFLAEVGERAQDLMLKENLRYKNVSITCLHICKNIHFYMYGKKTGRKHNVLNHTRLLFWRSNMTEHGHLWEVVLNILFFKIIYNENYFYNKHTKEEDKYLKGKSLSGGFLQKGSKLLSCICLNWVQKRFKGAFLRVSA